MSKRAAPLRLAVVGLGVMGQSHLRTLRMIQSVEITSLVDVDFAHAEKLAAQVGVGCKAFPSIESLVGAVDAAIVAVPSSMHRSTGEYLLSHGIHCLIEKPLALTESDCLALVQAAESSEKILMVGHVERFNPAVQQLYSYLQASGAKIYAFEARRMGMATRIIDADVVADLMVHDIDIISFLAKDKASSAKGNATRTTGIKKGDYAHAFLSYESGCVASLTASRISPNRIRDLLVTTDKGTLALNYASQELQLHHKTSRKSPDASLLESSFLDHSTERFFVRYAEPLLLELQHFIEAVTKGKKPLIDGKDALNTMRVVWEIQKSIEA